MVTAAVVAVSIDVATTVVVTAVVVTAVVVTAFVVTAVGVTTFVVTDVMATAVPVTTAVFVVIIAAFLALDTQRPSKDWIWPLNLTYFECYAHLKTLGHQLPDILSMLR